ncbi:MAG: alpha/beta fold hydrolase [Proteobacteria bacterium]|nr:alpha/beta fold hydrolase [Pseudomonadota bacterium]
MHKAAFFSNAFFLVFLSTLTCGLNYAQAEKPRFEPGDCPFSGVDAQDENITCGYLVVPEDRTKMNSRTLKLAVAVLKGRNTHPDAIPTVFLSGGPGAPAVQFTDGWLEEKLRNSGDLILYDQRGTGYSEPDFCPELGKDWFDVFTQDLTREEALAARLSDATRCHDSLLAKGIDLGAYNSAVSAADLNDLRKALGYKKWNLYGLSYGTRLALTTAREYPEGIRSMVLDAVVPPQMDLYTRAPEDLAKSLSAVFAACANDVACNEAYPNLEDTFNEIIRQLEQKPVGVPLDQPKLASRKSAYINSQDFIVFSHHVFLENKETIPVFPLFLSEFKAGNIDVGQILVPALGQLASFFDFGLYYTVQCYEERPFNTIEDWKRATGNHPLSRGGSPVFAGDLTICNAWNTARAPAIEDEPVHSDIPTLILSGEYDPSTPPFFGTSAASTLTNSYHYEFPGAGHGTTMYECGNSMMLQFFSDPTKAPDSSCIASIPPLVFATDVYLKPGLARLGMGLLLDEPNVITVVLLGFIVIVFLWVLISWPAGYVINRVKGRLNPRPKPVNRAVWLGRITAGLVFAFFISLGGFVMYTATANPGVLLLGLLGPAAPIFLLPPIIALLTLGVLYAAVWLWLKRYGSLLWRIHYSLVGLACISFIAFTWIWGLFGI